MRGALASLVAAAFGAAVALPCTAQLGGLGDPLKKLPGGSDRPAAAASAAPSRGGGSDAGLMPVKPKAGVEDQLKPDLRCRRFAESGDVWQALGEYGGQDAQMRMNRLLASDFKFSDLTPEDKRMLKYISYTTVWVPASVESGFGKLYIAATSKDRDSSTGDRSEAAQLARMQSQLQTFKSKIENFPGNVDLVVDRKLSTGAYSQMGGLIVLSPDFLNRMDEKEPVKQLILAHELSHLYKRHTVKETQYQLVTSSAGFDLARTLLRRYRPESSGNPVEMAKGAIAYANSARELFDWVRGHHVSFGIDQEFEADACSVQWMTRAGLDPKPLVPALAELEAVDQDAPTGYGKTHPTNAERREKLLVATGQKQAPTERAKPGVAAPPASVKAKKP